MMAGLTVWWQSIHPKRIEAVGTLIVLIAALWEALALRHASDTLSQLVFEDVAAKLRHIFFAIGAEHPQKYVYDYQNDFVLKVDVIGRIDEVKELLWIGYYANVRTILFIIGSVLIVVAKWREGRRA